MGTVFQNGKGGCWCERKMSKVGKSARYLRTYKTCLLGRATGLKLPNFTFILRRFKNVAFKVLNFKFVIHNSRIYFGKRPVKLVPSKNKQFPSSKGYFTFTIKGWTYYILFAPTGIKVTARRGRKIVRTFVTRKIKKILRPVKLPKISFILRRFKNVPFKVMNFKFVIHNSRIYFGKRPVKLVPSKNKQFPASKGYFTFTIKGWTYYILFAPTGIKVTARRGRKIVQTLVTRKIKKIIKHIKLSPIRMILKTYEGTDFHYKNMRFIIKNGKIYHRGAHVSESMTVRPSKNKRFPMTKGYYTYTMSGWTWYIKFGRYVTVYVTRGKKVVKLGTNTRRPKKYRKTPKKKAPKKKRRPQRPHRDKYIRRPKTGGKRPKKGGKKKKAPIRRPKRRRPHADKWLRRPKKGGKRPKKGGKRPKKGGK